MGVANIVHAWPASRGLIGRETQLVDGDALKEFQMPWAQQPGIQAAVERPRFALVAHHGKHLLHMRPRRGKKIVVLVGMTRRDRFELADPALPGRSMAPGAPPDAATAGDGDPLAEVESRCEFASRVSACRLACLNVLIEPRPGALQLLGPGGLSQVKTDEILTECSGGRKSSTRPTNASSSSGINFDLGLSSVLSTTLVSSLSAASSSSRFYRASVGSSGRSDFISTLTGRILCCFWIGIGYFLSKILEKIGNPLLNSENLPILPQGAAHD